MANLYITEKVNSVIVSDDKINVTVSSIGIQGAKGEDAYPTPLEANKLLTNDGDNVYWTDRPQNITIDAIDGMNGGYF